MRSPITEITMLLFGIILSVTAKAQIVTTNPLEYVALAEGNELILGKVKDQMDGQKKTALLQNTIAAEFEQMRQWEKKYNSYLKTASGFASSLKACTHLYNDGVRIFILAMQAEESHQRQSTGHCRRNEHEQPVYRDRNRTGDGILPAP